MAPSQKVYVQRGDRRVTQQSRGYLAEAYHTLTSPDNASVVRSVAIFGVSSPQNIPAGFRRRTGGRRHLV